MAKCKNCKQVFKPYQPLQIVCSYECSVELSKARMETKKAKAWAKEKAKRKEKLKTLTDYVNEAQVIFNKYIRKRDENEPCISCGCTTAKWDAGHYYNANNHWNVRFNEDNVHKQCSRPCNKDLSGNLTEYRFRLIDKIGIERVEYLDSVRNKTANFDVEIIKELKEVYKQKIKEL